MAAAQRARGLNALQRQIENPFRMSDHRQIEIRVFRFSDGPMTRRPDAPIADTTMMLIAASGSYGRRSRRGYPAECGCN